MPAVLTAVAVAIACVAGFALAQAGAPAAKPTADATQPAGAWPCYRGPNRNGISTQKDWNSDWSKAPAKLWEKDVGAGYSAVAAVGERIYTMGNAGGRDTIWCLEARTGKEVWKFPYACASKGGDKEHNGPRSTPAVDEGRVYTLSSEGHIFCLDAEKGTKIWELNANRDIGTHPPTWEYSSSPLVSGDKVFFDLGPIVALDKKTGRGVWKSKASKPGYSSPVAFKLGDQALIASFTGSGLAVVNAASGVEIASAGWSTSYDCHAATVCVEGDLLYISSNYGVGCALFKLEGGKLRQLWRNKEIKNHFNSSVVWKGCVYGVDEGGALVCLDLASGAVKWKQNGFGRGGSVLVADGKLIAMSDGGDIGVAPAGAEGFKPTGKFKALGGTCWTVPVLADGRLYVRNHEGGLVCYDVSKS
ncbi:MAG: PQQ-binding-like beta-propeller repeat protein [Phycisphaerae bacterium]